jgi:hypothetical protein
MAEDPDPILILMAKIADRFSGFVFVKFQVIHILDISEGDAWE